MNIKKNVSKYILLKIFTRQWLQGKKIPSKKALAIKFDTTDQIIMKVLNRFKTSGLIYSKEKKGYYISSNKYSYFFYSVEEFTSFNKIDTTTIDDFKIDNKIKKIIKQNNLDFLDFIKSNNSSFVRKYKNNEQIKKISYFIFTKTLFQKFINKDNIKNTPLYEFLAKNGILITKHHDLGFYSELEDATNNNNFSKRSWTILKFIYDIDKHPIAILLIKHIDNLTQESKILHKRHKEIISY